MVGMSEPTQDLLPLYDASRGFDTAMRGYDREQVDRELSRIDDDLRALAAERNSAAARSADLAAQLASAQAQIESLRRQLRAANEEVTAENVDERIKQMLQAAAADAAKVRADANTQAEEVRVGAADSAARTRAAAHAEAERIVGEATERMTEAEETFRRRIAEAEQHKTEIETALAASEERTRAEEARLSAEAEALRNRLDNEAAAERNRLDTESAAERARIDAASLSARTLAQEDFEITLRLRRSAAQKEEAEHKRAAEAEAVRTVADARDVARQLVADATLEVRRLHALRDGMHGDLAGLQSRLQAALDESLAATPDDPVLSESGNERP
ncbi:MAG: DivIVA protein, partial [Jatrophihabitans sp.]|nr:DivIVA protein [Jatrophihabitans sp.]